MTRTTIDTISVVGGRSRTGGVAPVERIDFRMGDVVSVVGPTGSGKTTLINDIELLAAGNTPTGRHILVNGAPADAERREDPSQNPIALITQHTTFLSDLSVREFLRTHARVRLSDSDAASTAVERTIAMANELTGEPVRLDCRMTELSGGQTRALLIADATVICATPIVLLDEVENAGIHRDRALEILRAHRKIFLFVTHDPHIALLSDYRLVMSDGAVTSVIRTSEAERALSSIVGRMDQALSKLRERIRQGENLEATAMEGWA
jgi:ABC-type lipoprotein export system ATPase subunit